MGKTENKIILMIVLIFLAFAIRDSRHWPPWRASGTASMPSFDADVAVLLSDDGAIVTQASYPASKFKSGRFVNDWRGRHLSLLRHLTVHAGGRDVGRGTPTAARSRVCGSRKRTPSACGAGSSPRPRATLTSSSRMTQIGLIVLICCARSSVALIFWLFFVSILGEVS